MRAFNLQTILSPLNKFWAFYLTIDGVNKSEASYLDVCVGVSYNCVIFNLHMLAISMQQRHTGLYMFELISRMLDNLASD